MLAPRARPVILCTAVGVKLASCILFNLTAYA